MVIQYHKGRSVGNRKRKLITLTTGILILVSVFFIFSQSNAATERKLYLPIMLNPVLNHCSSDLNNPGFEQQANCWTLYSTMGGGDIISSERAHFGFYSAKLGSYYENYREAWISQQMKVPHGKPNLTFWTYTDSQEPYCPQYNKYDYFIVIVNGKFHPDENSWVPLCEEQNGYWIKRSVDLSVYQGTTPSVKLFYGSDSTYPSNLFVDDFASEP